MLSDLSSFVRKFEGCEGERLRRLPHSPKQRHSAMDQGIMTRYRGSQGLKNVDKVTRVRRDDK